MTTRRRLNVTLTLGPQAREALKARKGDASRWVDALILAELERLEDRERRERLAAATEARLLAHREA